MFKTCLLKYLVMALYSVVMNNNDKLLPQITMKLDYFVLIFNGDMRYTFILTWPGIDIKIGQTVGIDDHASENNDEMSKKTRHPSSRLFWTTPTLAVRSWKEYSWIDFENCGHTLEVVWNLKRNGKMTHSCAFYCISLITDIASQMLRP